MQHDVDADAGTLGRPTGCRRTRAPAAVGARASRTACELPRSHPRPPTVRLDRPIADATDAGHDLCARLVAERVAGSVQHDMVVGITIGRSNGLSQELRPVARTLRRRKGCSARGRPSHVRTSEPMNSCTRRDFPTPAAPNSVKSTQARSSVARSNASSKLPELALSARRAEHPVAARGGRSDHAQPTSRNPVSGLVVVRPPQAAARRPPRPAESTHGSLRPGGSGPGAATSARQPRPTRPLLTSERRLERASRR